MLFGAGTTATNSPKQLNTNGFSKQGRNEGNLEEEEQDELLSSIHSIPQSSEIQEKQKQAV